MEVKPVTGRVSFPAGHNDTELDARPDPTTPSVGARHVTVQEALDIAVRHHAAGELPKAEEIYRQILRSDPRQPDALHLLGVIAHQVGDHKTAVDLIGQAVAIRHTFPQAHSNLGFALQALDRHDDAAASYRTSIVQAPHVAETHNNLGNALKDQGHLDDAAASYRTAIALKPDYAEAYYNLGNVYRARDALESAAECYRAALAIAPDLAEAHSHLGYALQELNRHEEAVESYEKALALMPGSALAHSSLAIAQNMCGRRDDAMANFDAGLAIHRGPAAAGGAGPAYRAVNRAKILHDIEQFEYLAANGTDPERFSALAAAYRTFMEATVWPEKDAERITLSDDQLAGLGGTFNTLLNRVDAPALPGSALNTALDTERITADYFAHRFGMTHVDGLLCDAALASLRRYLLESTIWFDCKYGGGYLGAMLHDGLACPLLLQIADDLREAFPRIFKHHKLKQLWAYKYDSRLTGIATHADFAAVNVNFWITPDEANLDPETGGLIVYNAEAPLDWDFRTYNTNQKRIADYIAQTGGGHIAVPHRQNRMVMFNSDLFHATDDIHFKTGYENRRINVTMLFGQRGDSTP